MYEEKQFKMFNGDETPPERCVIAQYLATHNQDKAQYIYQRVKMQCGLKH